MGHVASESTKLCTKTPISGHLAKSQYWETVVEGNHKRFPIKLPHYHDAEHVVDGAQCNITTTQQ